MKGSVRREGRGASSAAVVFWEVRLHPMNGSGLGKVGKQVIALFVSEQHTFLLEDGS